MNKTTVATGEAGIAYPPNNLIHRVFRRVRAADFFFCLEFCRSMFVFLFYSFDHCIVYRYATSCGTVNETKIIIEFRWATKHSAFHIVESSEFNRLENFVYCYVLQMETQKYDIY